MRRFLIVIFALACTLAAPATSGAMSSREGRIALKWELRHKWEAFTEHKPHIQAWCRPGRPARCHARYRGDRAHFTVRAKIWRRDDVYLVWLGDLRLL